MSVTRVWRSPSWGAPGWWLAAFGASVVACGLLLAVGDALRVKDLGDWAMTAGWPAATVVASAGLQLWWARTAGRFVERGHRRTALGVGTLGPVAIGCVAFTAWLIGAWPAS